MRHTVYTIHFSYSTLVAEYNILLTYFTFLIILAKGVEELLLLCNMFS